MLANGLFWTTAIHPSAFHVDENRALLRLRKIPLCDSLFFASGLGISATFSCTVKWKATTDRVTRGLGQGGSEADFTRFLGEFSDATCTARARGHETGFGFTTIGKLDASGYFAEFGTEKNGVFL